MSSAATMTVNSVDRTIMCWDDCRKVEFVISQRGPDSSTVNPVTIDTYAFHYIVSTLHTQYFHALAVITYNFEG